YHTCLATALHSPPLLVLFSATATAPTEIYTLSLHDALPIFPATARRGRWTHHQRRQRSQLLQSEPAGAAAAQVAVRHPAGTAWRSEEHTSELQSRVDLVCRLLLEKKKKDRQKYDAYKSEHVC